MKIAHQDTHTMVLRPQSLVFLIIGFILFVLGAWVVIDAFSAEKLTCAHTTQTGFTCVIQRTTFGATLSETRIEGIQRARMLERTSMTSPGRVMLATPDGEAGLPIFKGFDPDQQGQLAQEINAFIQTPQSTLFERSTGGTGFAFPTLYPLATAGVLLVVGLQNQGTTWTFDRRTGQLIYHRGTPLGVRTRVYALQDIVDVKLVRRRRALCVMLYLRDGQELFVDGSSANTDGLKSMVAAIRQFLELSAQTPLQRATTGEKESKWMN